jgi:hypothetical protein
MSLLIVYNATFIHIYTFGYIGFPRKEKMNSYEINDAP